MGHTPGPWQWLVYPDGRCLLTGPNNAVIHCPDASMTVSAEDRALIAAAPALLAACEAIYAWTARDIAMRRMSWFPELKAAIAQAKESP